MCFDWRPPFSDLENRRFVKTSSGQIDGALNAKGVFLLGRQWSPRARAPLPQVRKTHFCAIALTKNDHLPSQAGDKSNGKSKNDHVAFTALATGITTAFLAPLLALPRRFLVPQRDIVACSPGLCCNAHSLLLSHVQNASSFMTAPTPAIADASLGAAGIIHMM